jgi:hypothetical protein
MCECGCVEREGERERERERERALGVLAHTCNPNTLEAKEGGSQVQGKIGLHSRDLVSKKKKNRLGM